MEQQEQGIKFRLTLGQVLRVACPRQWLLLCICLLLPLLTSESLLCNYCRLHREGKCRRSITTECRPWERCYSGRGLYGVSHILSAQGCVYRELCGSVQNIRYRGTGCSMNYTCCCRDHCNLPTETDNSLKMLLGVTLSSSKGAATMISTTDNCPEEDAEEDAEDNALTPDSIKHR